MKNLKLLGFFAILISSLIFFQCTSDEPIYVAGEDGVDGVDGVDGQDGSAAACIACHSNSHRVPIHDAYNLSIHAMETIHSSGGVDYVTSQYTNRGTCTACHTHSGYIDYVETGMTIDVGDRPGWDGDQTIRCTTCHSNHSTFDFENDGPDYALRSIAPVTLVYDESTVVDFEGTSNMCTTCHQPRTTPVPVDDGSGIVSITSSRYGPHHGPQSTVLEGILGANIPGSEGYPGIGANGDNTHRTGASCVSCHMGETTDGSDGSHTMWPTENTCTTCHSSGAPEEVTGYATNMETLRTLLVSAGVLSDSGSVVPGDYPVEVAQAVWNYKVLEEDKSHGVHNPKYAKALLINSIEALQD